VRLSVVIPTLDEAERISESVLSAVGGADEVLVVDGGSRDGTPSRAETAGARVISSTPGRARQLGVGAEAAQGDVLLFLHADTQLPVGWASAVRGALADEAVAGGAFRLRFDERTLVFRLLEWGTRLRVALLRLPYGDQAIFVRRRVLDAIGGVPQVPVMEDLDLVAGLKQRGRLALLALPAITSTRRYRARGPLRTSARHLLAALAWACGRDRARIAAWLRR
jgi:rSAM/selenodomain-associated transferase 2